MSTSFILDKEISENYPENWGVEEKRIADAVTRLNELKSRGVDTIVDLTVIGLGRYIPASNGSRSRRNSRSSWRRESTRITMCHFSFTIAGLVPCWVGRN